MAERYSEAEMVLDDELMYDEAPRRSAFLRRDDRPEDIVREGEVLAGKYRVERIPGRNGLGVIVQVRHLELGQEVTLKFLVPEACAYPEFVQRFVREARSAVRIQGEHVARVTDVGRLESGAPYMVREFLRGPDLAEVLKVRGPLPIAEAVDYIIQACEGVAEGHALGVVHRNLRPTSLVVVRRSDGTPLIKVFDFAAAESLHVNPFTERAVSLVGTSAIMASLPYLAPEQIRDPHDVDFRADVYSLGAVLYELLTGVPVYAADAAPALLAQVAADPAPAVRSLRQDASGELDHVVLRCLAKNRAIRYPSIAELSLALAPFASEEMASSIDRIQRLARRTSKVPELGESRTPSLPPPSTPPLRPSVEPTSARGPRGTMPLHTPEVATAHSLGRSSVHDDVTTVNPYASYAAPVIITPEPLRPARTRTQPFPSEPARPEPVRVDPVRTERLPAVRASEPARHTPQPPPLRSSSVPPPLRAPAAVSAQSTPAQSQASAESTPLPLPQSERPEPRVDSTSLPPPRSSMSGLTRSWAVADEPSTPFFTQRRLIGVGAVALFATLGAVLALRTTPAPAVAAAAPSVAAPARVEPPPPAPVPAPVEPAPVVAASAAPAPAASAPAMVAVTVPGVAAPMMVPVSALTSAPVAAAPAPVAVAAPAAPPVARAPVVAAAPAPIARRPAAKPRDEAPVDASSRKPAAAAEQKVASARAGAGDLFGDQR
jgi:eukaryotic-like serine/threonine-protein kinase